MPKIEWGSLEDRKYTNGVDQGIVYFGDKYEVWSGLVSVKDSVEYPSEGVVYIDGIPVSTNRTRSENKYLITSYRLPDLLLEALGYRSFGVLGFDGQERGKVGVSWRTFEIDHSEKKQPVYHFLYNALPIASSFEYHTMSDDTSLQKIDCGFTCIPVNYKGSWLSHVWISGESLSEKDRQTIFSDLELVIYGTNNTDPKMPSPLELDRIGTKSLEFSFNDVSREGLNYLNMTNNGDIYGSLSEGLYRLKKNSSIQQESSSGLFRKV